MDDQIISTYLAGKVIEDIRKNRLKPEVALAMSINPFNDYMRQKLQPDDINPILDLFRNDTVQESKPLA